MAQRWKSEPAERLMASLLELATAIVELGVVQRDEKVRRGAAVRKRNTATRDAERYDEFRGFREHAEPDVKVTDTRRYMARAELKREGAELAPNTINTRAETIRKSIAREAKRRNTGQV